MAASKLRGSAVDKKQLILDAAIRVFARKGFHGSPVSDIADEAQVAYGLIYHYFKSKDEILDTLFLQRWSLLLQFIGQVDANKSLKASDKLYQIASFIIDSYAHDSDVMKVIIVEVTRAANSFGKTHLDKISEAYDGIANIVEQAQGNGEFKADISPRFAALVFYGAMEQVLTGWIFNLLPAGEADFEQAKRFAVNVICSGLTLSDGSSG